MLEVIFANNNKASTFLLSLVNNGCKLYFTRF